MSAEKQWQQYAQDLKEILHLDNSPVGISCLKDAKVTEVKGKERICRGFLKAAKGETVKINKDTNACFGAAWHLGFRKLDNNPKILNMVKKFVVEGEKLFCSYPALDTLISQMEPVPDNSRAFFLLCPLEQWEQKPQLVMFVCNPDAACRLLTLVTFSDGVMPKIKIGGPTCRMAVMYPLLKGEVNISFYDYTARKMCNVDKDKLLVTVPYGRIPQIVESVDKCTAGRARFEYLPEFRAFLQKRLTK